jgi:hypothetical protein
MKIRFTANGTDQDQDLQSLYSWLRNDRALRRLVELDPVDTQAGPDDMGPGLDMVVAIISAASAGVSATAAVGQLTISLRQWREVRRPRSEIRIGVEDGDTGEAEPIRKALSEPMPDPEPGE